MTKVSECCGKAIIDVKRRGRVSMVCSRCHKTTTIQKRIVIKGMWSNPHTGQV